VLYFSALIFVVTVLVFFRPASNHRGLAVIFASSATIYLLFTLFYLIADYLSTNGIDESVAYHLFIDVGGVGIQDFKDQVVIGLIVSVNRSHVVSTLI